MIRIKGDADLYSEEAAREEYGEECINEVLEGPHGENEVDFEGNALVVLEDWEANA